MLTLHIQERLESRGINISRAVIEGLCYEYNNAAVIVAKSEHKGINHGSFYSRNESNGDLVVLIIRDNKPITVMFRRSGQTNTASQLRVNQVIDLTH